jgi:hypothetical protein
MRRKVGIVILAFILIAIVAHFLGMAVVIGAGIVFGLGFLFGRRRANNK